MTQLRIWWIPQVPMAAFHVDVPDLVTADLLLDTLGKYDAFQLENNVKPDCCNAGGLEMFEDGEWIDWYDDDLNCEFEEWRETYGLRAASAIEARQGGDGEAGSVEDESAVPKGDAKNG